MNKRLLTVMTFLILILLSGSSARAAELLVQAKPHWQDGWDADQIKNLSVKERQSYDARTQIGDVIVVRPDGWQWGKEERLPNFVVIKIPSLSYELAKKYEESLSDSTSLEGPILKIRKWQIPQALINSAVAQKQNVVVVDSGYAMVFINDLLQKDR